MLCAHAGICRAIVFSKNLNIRFPPLAMLKFLALSDSGVCNSEVWNIGLAVLVLIVFGLFCSPAFELFEFCLQLNDGQIPMKSFAFRNSEVLSWAHCDSSKPGRSTSRSEIPLLPGKKKNSILFTFISQLRALRVSSSERWVLHSTREYAERVIAEVGLKKPSEALLKRVAEELLQELQGTGLNIPQPFLARAHRWYA